MKNALTRIIAAAGAPDCGRSALARALVLGCAVACASLPAMAEQDRDRDGPRAAAAQSAQPNREPRRAEPQPPPRQADTARPDPRQFDPRAFEEQRRQLQQQQEQNAQHADGGRRGGRLTPDERRELRRQINEAGIDLYPNTPRR